MEQGLGKFCNVNGLPHKYQKNNVITLIFYII